MPTTSCGLLLIPGVSGGGGFLITIALAFLQPYSLWVKVPVAVVAGLLGAFVGVLTLHLVPWSFEWFLAMCHRCPDCGKRRWSFPFTEGFGL